MKKSVLPVILCIMGKNLSAVESNHSYFKNSDFTNDYSVEVKGFGDFSLIYNQEKVNDKTTSIADRGFYGLMSVVISSNYDESFRYGVRFVNAISNQFGDGLGAEIFLEGSLGKLEFGGLNDVTEKMRVGADTLSVGAGGIGGDAPKYNSSIELIDFLMAPGTLMNQNFGYYDQNLRHKWGGKFSNKINYTTPEFFGFQMGLSLKPNVTIDRHEVTKLKSQNGSGTSGGSNMEVNLGTFVSGGINYINTFGDFGVAAAFIYEENFANPINVSSGTKEAIGGKFKSGEVSLSLSYFGLSIAGSYGMNSRNITDTNLASLNITKSKGRYFTYGVSYEMGSFCISATFFDSKNDDDRKLWSDSYAVKYNVSRNLSWYVEGIRYKFSGNSIANKHGNALGVFTGILVQF